MSQVEAQNAMVHPISGLVAQILNERELVINVGSTSGVKVGTTFAVLAQSPLEITDPVSKQVLGTIDREKVRVRAMDVQAKITICRTYRTFKTPAGPLFYPLGRLGLGDPPKEIPETLRASESSLPKPLSPEESYVQIKDRVVEVTE